MKVTLILAVSLFLIGSGAGIAFSNSRLNNIDCGPNMSRLDAEKCEQIRRAKSRDHSDSENKKWHGPGGYIKLKNGKLYTGGTIYYPSKKSANKWHGSGGYIKLKGGKLYTPDGNIYYPSAN